jgi:formylglycine-generating enzyme required for sulfatase activity
MADYILLAGISDYRDKYLSNLRLAHRDAQNLHGLFRHGLGFGDKAILLPADVSLRDFNRQFNEISQRLTVDDRFIFYFSGHGYQHGDEQYLLLAEAEKGEVEAGRLTMQEVIALQTLKARVDRLPIRQSLFLLDTCRRPLDANTHHGSEAPYQGNRILDRMFARDPGFGPELHEGKLTHATRSIILNACSDGDYAWEPANGDASVLVKAFESAFAEPLKRGEAIQIDATTPRLLRQHILRHFGSDHPQTPWISPSDGSFELRSAEQREATPPPEGARESNKTTSSTPDALERDEYEWRLVSLTNEVATFKEYIRNAPASSPHIEYAFKRIEALQPPRTLPAGTVFRDANFAPEMVVIPPGEFWMGSPDDEEGRCSDEGPRHKVTIGYSFAVGKNPVTQAEWLAVMGNNPSWFKNKPTNPVETVSWEDAQAYVKTLSEMIGKSYRLLSEAEWEYCCRAGTTTAYNTGNVITRDQANFYGDETTPAEHYPANAFGLHDMHGNVLEWVEDWIQYGYEGTPEDGSAWITGSEQDYRVLRGGSWFLIPCFVRSAGRIGIPSIGRGDDIGFRVARMLP